MNWQQKAFRAEALRLLRSAPEGVAPETVTLANTFAELEAEGKCERVPGRIPTWRLTSPPTVQRRSGPR